MTLRESLKMNGSSAANGHNITKRHSIVPAYPRGVYQQDGNPTHGNKPIKGPYPHLRDLQKDATTKLQGYGVLVPIRTLLGCAQACVDRVDTDVTYKRPHLAYVEYIVGSSLLLDLIPRHKDFPEFRSDRGQWGQLYNSLCKSIDTKNGMFQEIKNTIVEDNIRNGTRSAGEKGTRRSSSIDTPLRSPGSTSRPTSMSITPKPAPQRADELFIDATPPTDSLVPRAKPTVRPKPEALHSQSAVRDGATHAPQTDILSQRFSQLRIQQRNTPRGSLDSGSTLRRVIPSPSELTSTSPDIVSNISSPTGPSSLESCTDKPSGPRNMPLASHTPLLPPKIPLSDLPLPRAPSPAYDPAKSKLTPVDTGSPISHRQSQQMSIDQSPQSSESSRALYKSSNAYTSPSEPILPPAKAQAKKTCITSAELFEILQHSNVLVIDVRDRENYDEGHIQARSIMCIEPLTLRSGTSAEDLEDRLVISPENEQSMFERRNEFDLIVYYDQQTQSDSFLQGPPTRTSANALRALHDTLYEFNDYKPLRRPPLVLLGGLNSWTELVGTHALTLSRTSGSNKSGAAKKSAKVGRPIGRVPMASANSSLEVRKRRLKEQNTLNADEERKWLEKAKNEEVNPEDYQQDDLSTNTGDEDQPSPYIQSYEDFLRRFPEASPVQQSMSLATPPPPPPPPTRRPPAFPPPPPLPSIPSRPAPAVPRPSYSGVSERESAQSNTPALRHSSSQYPLFTPRSTSRFLKLPQTGLINFGVTCYMNATIQCLLATIPLSQLFLDNRWRDFLQKNWKGSNGILPGIFANLIRSLWCNDCVAIRPTSIRSLCGQLKQEWGEDRQQDAKEFFDFLVDCLHEDLNVNWNRTPLQPLTPQMEMQREHMPIRKVSDIEWRRYSHREQSPISDLFAGQHASRLRCTVCRNTSTTYEAFYSISVEIPRQANRRSGGSWDLHDCLRSYTQEERLSKDEMWKCPYCKCEREATKQITITRAPHFLVVHFKRFEMRKGESAKKMHTAIHFPLFGLDIGNYMIPPASQKEIQADPEYVPELATSQPYLYDAYAVMRHLGASGNGGHYVSLVRDASKGCWRKYDDDRVTDFDPGKLKTAERLQNEQAYLVFYCRAAAR